MDIFFIFGAKYLYLICIVSGGIAFLMLRRSEQKRMIWLAFIALPLTYLIAKTASHFYFDPRPFVQGNFTPLVPHAPDNGFPSDHMLLVSAIAAVFYPFRRTWSYALFALAAFVAVSRVYVGVHHAVDVIGSFFIASVSVGISYAILKQLKRKYKFEWLG